MKILYVTTIASTMNFFTDLIEDLSKHGVEVSILTNTKVKEINPYYMDNHFPIYHVPFSRSIKSINNIKAYKEVKNLLKEKKFDIIHTHTPIASTIVRLVCKNLKIKSRVIYTAHGFHFYKGAPLKNWLLFYPIEKYLSKYTDDLITINNEDYELAKRKFKAKNNILTHGVGINPQLLNNVGGMDRKDLNIKKDDYVLIFAGELNDNKNQVILIDSLKYLKQHIPNIKLLLLGEGIQKNNLLAKIKTENLEDTVFLLGRKRNVSDYISISNVAVSASKREGMGMFLLESMYLGLPVVASDNRGHRTIIKTENNGYLISLNNYVRDFNKCILSLYEDIGLYNNMSESSKKIASSFTLKVIKNEIFAIYGI